MNTSWIEGNNALCKTFVFKDFREALAFVNMVGELAEKMKHHPDIGIENYNHVKIKLSTHDAGGVTDKDREMATLVDTL